MVRITGGPAPDPDAVRTSTPAIGEVTAPAVIERPPPPVDLHGQHVQDWWLFWESDVAGAVFTAHLPALERLFLMRQESEDAHRSCRDSPTVEGSQEQQVANPECRHATELDKEIRQLEDRFGMTPLAQLRLGIKTGQAARARRDTREVLAEEQAERARAHQEAIDRYADPRLTEPGSSLAE